MGNHADLLNLTIVALIALVVGLLMTRLRQPAVVGYIVAGVVLGPSALELVSDREQITLLAELGVLTLLFLIGMELSLRAFKQIWRVAVGTALLQIGASVGLLCLFALAFGWSLNVAIVLGFVVALSSTAVVIKMLEQMNMLRQPAGQLTVGVLIAQDLAVVPILVALSVLSDTGFDPIDLAKVALSILLLIAFIYFLSRRKRLVLPLTTLVRGSFDLQPLAALVMCFGGAALTGLLGISPALGAFLAGLLIGNSTARPAMVRATLPIQSVLMMVFFLSIGLLIDLNFVWANLGTVIVLLILVTAAKTALNIGILHLLREPWPHAFIAGILLAQVGEFSLVVGQTANIAGILSDRQAQLVIVVVALSLLITPLWLTGARRMARLVVKRVGTFDESLRALRPRFVFRIWRLARDLIRGFRARRKLKALPAPDAADPQEPTPAKGRKRQAKPAAASAKRSAGKKAGAKRARAKPGASKTGKS